MSGHAAPASAEVPLNGLVHDALFYSSEAEYAAGIARFAVAGLDAGEAVLIAVPAERHALLRRALEPLDPRVELLDMRLRGKNPARILPCIQAFLDLRPHVPVRFVGEPIWGGRTPCEIVEGHRHEALINEAFAGRPVHILCPYDLRALDPAVIDDARRTHPTIVGAAGRTRSAAYVDPASVYAAEDSPFAEPADATILSFAGGLAGFRVEVAGYARSHGLPEPQIAALALAAHEAAANTVVHGGRDGTARIWHDGAEVVCEVADTGRIDDLLVGRRVPLPDRPGERGIWLINQLCDLVELRSGTAGTVVRMHMDFPAGGDTVTRGP